MPDDHGKLVPLLPIPNRTVKRLSADDSAGSRVKVGHRQAVTASKTLAQQSGGFCFFRHSQAYLLVHATIRYFAIDSTHLQSKRRTYSSYLTFGIKLLSKHSFQPI